MKTDIGVISTNRKKVSELLNVLLADETVLYIKTRNYHWNIEGPNFYGLHILLENHYTELGVIIDDIAERVRQLGHKATATMAEYLNTTNLKESSTDNEKLDEKGMLKSLVLDHEEIIKELRDDIDKFENEYDEPASADFVTNLVEKHEKMVWMLRSSVGK